MGEEGHVMSENLSKATQDDVPLLPHRLLHQGPQASSGIKKYYIF